MEEKTTCEKIVIDFLKSRTGGIIQHYTLDSTLPSYGVGNFNKIYSPATYHRVFCWVKNDPDLLRENGIELEQLVGGSGKVNKWLVKSLIEEQIEIFQ